MHSFFFGFENVPNKTYITYWFVWKLNHIGKYVCSSLFGNLKKKKKIPERRYTRNHHLIKFEHSLSSLEHSRNGLDIAVMTMIAKKVAWSPRTALPSPSNFYICNNENVIVTKNQCFIYHKMWLYFYLQHYLGNPHCRRLLYNILLLYRFLSSMVKKIQLFAGVSLAAHSTVSLGMPLQIRTPYCHSCERK